ncbi:MAG: SPOR domain-containing protein [Melioribacteraceae bacterium]|nr:SPOR domain-containing protein [Melioribacteraceae bacterium]
MKKRSIVILIILISIGQLFAQTKKKWTVIKNNDESVLYIDANNIKEIDNQISIWSLETFKNNKTTEDGKSISKVKTQYLINKLTKKYSEIGSIKYDETGRIIHDLNAQTKSSLQSNVSISSSGKVIKLFNKAEEFLRTGNLADEVQPIKKEIKHTAAKEPEPEIKVDSVKIIEKVDPNLIVIKGTRKPTFVESEPVTEISFQEEKPVDIAPAKPVLTEDDKKIEIAEEVGTAKEYNVEKEENVEGTIYSDGNLFCVQISSWKNKRKAELQVEKYKNKGYNSFYTEIYIAKKRSTWYRVRVGYFDSIIESRRISRELN